MILEAKSTDSNERGGLLDIQGHMVLLLKLSMPRPSLQNTLADLAIYKQNAPAYDSM